MRLRFIVDVDVDPISDSIVQTLQDEAELPWRDVLHG